MREPGKSYSADYHVHTEYSDDSVCPMEEMVKRGLEIGLDEICFTDHVDYGIKLDWGETAGECRIEDGQPVRNVDYKPYLRQIEELQAKYQGKMVLKKGLEFGVQTGTIPQYEALFAAYPLDFVILSIHEIGNQEFWNNAYQATRTQKQVNDDYYNELYQIVKTYQNYSVVGHLDLIKRYDSRGIYPFEKNREIIAEILKTVIANGKGIEVNTSSFYYKLPDLQPCTEILKLYRDLGGKIITIGSDAHQPAYLADHMQEVKAKLAALGYTHTCTFAGMQPMFHAIG